MLSSRMELLLTPENETFARQKMHEIVQNEVIALALTSFLHDSGWTRPRTWP